MNVGNVNATKDVIDGDRRKTEREVAECARISKSEYSADTNFLVKNEFNTVAPLAVENKQKLNKITRGSSRYLKVCVVFLSDNTLGPHERNAQEVPSPVRQYRECTSSLGKCAQP